MRRLPLCCLLVPPDFSCVARGRLPSTLLMSIAHNVKSSENKAHACQSLQRSPTPGPPTSASRSCWRGCWR